jgi:hypothetical protein
MNANRTNEVRASELLEWNDVFPDVRVVQEEKTGATDTFMVIADYGWAERILCERCYLQDAEAICAAIREARPGPLPASAIDQVEHTKIG